MKHRRLGPLLGAALLVGSSPVLGQVEVRSDQGQSIYRVGPVRTSEFTLTADFTCPGEDACDPGTVRVIFSMTDYGPLLHKDDYSVQLVLDEETELAVASPQYLQQSAGGAYVTELIICRIPTTDFRVIANAKKVEYRIGASKGQLTKKQRKALEALAEELIELVEPEVAGDPEV